VADAGSSPDLTAGDHGAGPIRTASVVSFHKIAHLLGAALSVVVLPRLLGTEDFGRLAFVLSLSYLGQIAGDFGTLDVLAHFVPNASPEDRSRLYSRTLAFKLAAAPACGAATAIVGLVLAEWMRIGWAVAVGVGVALHIVAWVPYQFALAERRVGVWMTEQSWRQWITLGGFVLLYPAIGFEGALAALVGSEALFCVGGLRWVAHAFDRRQLRLEADSLAPLVRFGLGFFAANIATVVLYRSGPLLVAVLTSSTLETGCIELALGLFLVAYVTISHFAQSLLPVLSAGRQDPDRIEMRRWLAGFLRVGMVTAIVTAAAVWLTADWAAPLVFGRALGAAAAPIKVIALAIPAAVLAWAGNVLATACGRPGSRMRAALVAMSVFLGGALIGIPSAGAVAAAAAVGAAVAVHALVLWRALRHELDLLACLFGRGLRRGEVTGTGA
jgi:O-antigen/teichoic acid export membrane protein